jgi:hypothetical protein
MYRHNFPLLALAMYASRQVVPAPSKFRQLAAEEESAVPAFASLLGNLPGMETLKEFLAKLNHG